MFRPAAMTRFAPRWRATWMASWPATPVAPMMRTVSPAARPARSFSVIQADMPGLAMAAAVASSRDSGMGMQLIAGRGRALRHGSPGLAHEDEKDTAAVVEHTDAVETGNGGARFGSGIMRTAGDRFDDWVKSGCAHLDENFAFDRLGIGERLILRWFAGNVDYGCLHEMCPRLVRFDSVRCGQDSCKRRRCWR